MHLTAKSLSTLLEVIRIELLMTFDTPHVIFHLSSFVTMSLYMLYHFRDILAGRTWSIYNSKVQ